MSDLQWIACQGVDLTPYNLSVVERLKNFGYALVFDEFGNNKTDKAQLCIHNRIVENARAGTKSKILVVCPESLMQNWYANLLSGIGVDFAFLPGNEKSVFYFSDKLSNFCIIGEERLKSSAMSGVTADPALVWDLLIIDASLAVDGADWPGYTKYCKNKAKNILVFAPSPFPHDTNIISAVAPLKEMLREFLHDPNHCELVGNLRVDETIIEFGKETPVMRYYTAGKLGGRAPNVTKIEYEINKDLFNSSNRMIDIQTGLPFYSYGGNVFEEYEPETRHIYVRSRYDEKDVKALREADSKLDAFLDKLDEIFKNQENNAVVYFTSKATLKYIAKVLRAIYPGLSNSGKILVRTDSVLDSEFLRGWFGGGDADSARIMLATDLIGEHYHGLGRATHIFNYEYPVNPADLERRFFRAARTGVKTVVPEEFIVFSDKDMMFDGRILSKVMVSGLPRCFKKKLPSQNVLFWVPDAQRYIAETIADLKYIVDNAKGAGVDYARHFCGEYNITDRGLVSTAMKAGKYAELTLEKLARLFGIEQNIPGDGIPVDKKEVFESLGEILEKIRKGLIYYDDEMKPCIVRNVNDMEALAQLYAEDEYILGVRAARDELESMFEAPSGDSADSDKFPPVHAALRELPEELRTPVMYNIWKYCKLNKGISKPLREFTEQYNGGVI